MTAHPLDPELDCDLIMKGGITGGVIYPGVVCRLARVYRLRSVGGASAGALPRPMLRLVPYDDPAPGPLREPSRP